MHTVKSRRNGLVIHLNSRTSGLLRNFGTQGGNELVFEPPKGAPRRVDPEMRIGSPAEEEANRLALELEARDEKLKAMAAELDRRDAEVKALEAAAQEEADAKAVAIAQEAEAEAAAKTTAAPKTATKTATKAATKTAGKKTPQPDITDLA